MIFFLNKFKPKCRLMKCFFIKIQFHGNSKIDESSCFFLDLDRFWKNMLPIGFCFGQSVPDCWLTYS